MYISVQSQMIKCLIFDVSEHQTMGLLPPSLPGLVEVTVDSVAVGAMGVLVVTEVAVVAMEEEVVAALVVASLVKQDVAVVITVDSPVAVASGEVPEEDMEEEGDLEGGINTSWRF